MNQEIHNLPQKLGFQKFFKLYSLCFSILSKCSIMSVCGFFCLFVFLIPVLAILETCLCLYLSGSLLSVFH